jgi:hypothetical protein
MITEMASRALETSDPFNEFEVERLGNLAPGESREMLLTLVQDRCELRPDALQRLIEHGAGRPFFLNMLARLAFEEMRRAGSRMIRDEDVEKAIAAAPTKLDALYRRYYNDLNVGARRALDELVHHPDEILPDTYKEDLERVGLTVGWPPALRLDPIFISWHGKRKGG